MLHCIASSIAEEIMKRANVPKTHRRNVKMTSVWSALASIIQTLANLGAGMVSTGATYEPEVPEELRK